MAIFFALALFFFGRSKNRRWIVARGAAELLRQCQYLGIVFPSGNSTSAEQDVKAQFASESRRIEGYIQRGLIINVVARIEDFWLNRKASVAAHALTDADVTADAVLIYLDKRVRRQLGWFADSRERLEHIGERRTAILLCLYVLAAALAAIKFVLFLRDDASHDYLLPPLLLVTGLSAAMTAYYINQNSRSLIHRYYTQQRFIKEWLKAFNERWNFGCLLSKSFNDDEKKAIRAEILRFEDLMIEELIDWAHITSHDAIELAP
jgi:hypothetical protein